MMYDLGSERAVRRGEMGQSEVDHFDRLLYVPIRRESVSLFNHVLNRPWEKYPRAVFSWEIGLGQTR